MKDLVLLIDDEEDLLWLMEKRLQENGYDIITAIDGEQGIELFQQRRPQVVITDLRLPRMDGMEVLKKILQLDANVPVIMMTAHGSGEVGKEAMRIGAYNYISKPFNFDELVFLITKAIEARALKHEVLRLREETSKAHGFGEFIGNTPQMRDLRRMIEKVAQSDAPTVFLQGESGTGKNFVARLIHTKSKRAERPFMEINCASLPENLIESELFGYEKGAFTDAKQMKLGLFEVARGGTVFLDEISEMNISTQAKLLQAIETHMFRRVGGVNDIETDVRIIAASNMNLKEAIAQKRLREDLYFRLHLIPIVIPPLRERVEDIPLLIENMIRTFNQEYRKGIKGVTAEAMILFKSYPWPGNIRELRNVIERITILESDSEIGISNLPYEIKDGGQGGDRADYQIPECGVDLENVERQFIVQALRKTTGNQSRAAKLLGITRHTLRYRMEKFGLH